MIYIPGVSSILETLPNGTQRGLWCWVDGGWASGNYPTNRWFEVEGNGGTEADHGYINASLLANQRTTPHCDARSMGMLTSTVTLAQGSLASNGTYSYTIAVSDFPRTLNPKNTVRISGECYSSVYSSGFAQFTITTDYFGDGISQNVCPGSDGPDHWVVAGWITSNHIQWGGGGTSNPQPPAAAKVTLAKGPVYSGNIYRYAITLSGFPANTPVSVACYDSVSPKGFFHFTMTTDGSGNASTQSECYSGDGPDHWVVAGGVTSNHVQWGGGSTGNPQQPTPTATPEPPTGPTPTPTPTTGPGQITYAEQEGHLGANTFTNPYNASGMGPKIPAAAWVQVTCKVYAPEIQSVNPDGYWYRITSSPWNNAYYAAANTFMNGDPWGGPYTHNTDFNVPDC